MWLKRGCFITKFVALWPIGLTILFELTKYLSYQSKLLFSKQLQWRDNILTASYPEMTYSRSSKYQGSTEFQLIGLQF